MEEPTFLSTFAEGLALESVKGVAGEIILKLAKFCGGNLKTYSKDSTPLLSLLPQGSVQRALNGGVIIQSKVDAEQILEKFPGLRRLTPQHISEWEKKLREALAKAPKYSSFIMALDTEDIADVIMEVVEESKASKHITREWVAVTVEDLKGRLE